MSEKISVKEESGIPRILEQLLRRHFCCQVVSCLINEGQDAQETTQRDSQDEEAKIDSIEAYV